MKIDYFQNLEVSVCSGPKATGHEAGRAIEETILALSKTKEYIRIIFAAAPSQNHMLDYLSSSQDIDWSKVQAFNMDEYIGIDQQNPRSFAYYLRNRLFDKVKLGRADLLNGMSLPDTEIKRYKEALAESPIDIVCFGIGENGHLAFNDPPVADFDDMKDVKVVNLDYDCRMQQVNEGCFERLEDVPKQAFTITIPTIMKAEYLFGVVTGKHKQSAVRKTLEGPLETDCPASIIRKHPNCHLFLDHDAYNPIIDKND